MTNILETLNLNNTCFHMRFFETGKITFKSQDHLLHNIFKYCCILVMFNYLQHVNF